MQKNLQKLLCPILLALTVTSCITIRDKTFCSAAGSIRSGAICTHLLTGVKSELTFEQYIDFLEATPAKPAAIAMSSEDFGSLKTELEEACRMLGKRCRYETKLILENLDIELENPN